MTELPSENQDPDPQKRFTIALSFPGEHRVFVLKVANILKDHVGEGRVFYDEWYEHELVGVDGDLKLRRYYREQSHIIVPFFSEFYEKPWCGIEWSAIRAMLKDCRSEDRVIPVAMDDTVIEGWESTDFAIQKKNRSAKEIADVILKAYWFRIRIDPNSDVRLIELSEERLSEEFDEAEKKRQHGINQLKAAVTWILQSDKTRRFILSRNELSADLSAADLTDQIFDTIPQYLDDENAYCTPICYLRRCATPNPRAVQLSREDQDEVKTTLWTLAGLLAPISFVVDDTDEIQKLIREVTRHAQFSTSNPKAGGAVVASFLGCELDLDHCETILREGDCTFTGREAEGFGKVFTGSFLPISGIENHDIVQVVARGLAPQLGAADGTEKVVKAALRDLASDKSYVCLWLNWTLHPEAAQKLRDAYPHLYVLTSRSQDDLQVNELVYQQIEKLRKFVGANV